MQTQRTVQRNFVDDFGGQFHPWRPSGQKRQKEVQEAQLPQRFR